MPSSSQEHGSNVRLGGGRGIVVPASGRKQLANAYASLRVLRRELACRLPVVLVYHGDASMPADLRLLFEVRHTLGRSSDLVTARQAAAARSAACLQGTLIPQADPSSHHRQAVFVVMTQEGAQSNHRFEP